MASFKAFDFYKMIQSDIRQRSKVGGTTSLIAISLIGFLLVCETIGFLSGETTSSIIVDDHSESGAFWVNFNVTLLAATCDHVSVDVEDRLGTRIFDIQKNVEKTPIDRQGRITKLPDDSHHHETADNHVSTSEIDMANNRVAHEDYSPVILKKDTFDKYLEDHEWVFVNFRVNWCPWCQMLDPVWKQAGEVLIRRGVDVHMPKVECVDQQKLCERKHVMAFPTLKLFHKGKYVPPDYRGPRTVNNLVKFAEKAAEHKDKAVKAKEENKHSDVKTLSTDREDVACNLVGHLFVHRVPGRVQFSVKSDQHNFNKEMINFTHQVHHFSFNEIPESTEEMQKIMADEIYQGRASKWYSKVFPSPNKHITHEHYLKIVETEHRHKRGFGMSGTQYLYEHSISSHSYRWDPKDHAAGGKNKKTTTDSLPHVKFHYDLSPMQVLIQDKAKPWFRFFTMLLALVGGVYTLFGVLNEVAHGVVSKKQRLGRNK